MEHTNETNNKRRVRRGAAVLCALAVSAMAFVSWISGSVPSSAVLFAPSLTDVTIKLYTTKSSPTGIIWVDNNNGDNYETLGSFVATTGVRTLKVPGGPREKVKKFCLCATSVSWSGSLAVMHQVRWSYPKDGGNGLQTSLVYGGDSACQSYSIVGLLKPVIKAGNKKVSYDKCGLKTWTVNLQSRMRVSFPSYLYLAADDALSARLERVPQLIPAGGSVSHKSLLVRGLKKHFCVCARSGSARFTGTVTSIIAPKKDGKSDKVAYLRPLTSTGGMFDVTPGRCAIFDAKESGKKAGYTLRSYAATCPSK